MALIINGKDATTAAGVTALPTIFKDAYGKSVVGQLNPTAAPLSLAGTDIPVFNSQFNVGYTPEMGAKPVGDGKFTMRRIVPKKFAGLFPVSTEALQQDEQYGTQDAVIQALQDAVQRQIDLGVLYGVSANTLNKVPEVVAANDTTHRVTLDPSKDIVPPILAGADSLGDEYDPDGFAFSTKLRTKVAMAGQRQAPGVAQPALPDLRSGLIQSLAGLNLAYSKGVHLGNKGNTLGFVGDWSNLTWGFGRDVRIDSSDVASYTDGGKLVSAFENNVTVYRIEFWLGWSLDVDAFAAYDKPAV